MTVVSADRAVQARLDPSPLRAAAMIALSWLPALVIAAFLPRYVPTFDRWHQELPPLTLALMSIGRLGVWPIVLAGVGLVAVLAGVGAGWVRARLSHRRTVVFALAATGIGLIAVLLAGTLGPIITMPPPAAW
jgi:hypothetical protein